MFSHPFVRLPVAGISIMIAVLLAPLRPVWAASTVKLTAPFTSSGSGAAETSIGDLTADALRSASGSQVALVDAEALYSITLPKGAAAVSQFSTALKFPADPVVVLTVRGNVLAGALERGVSNLPQSSPGFLQISGIALTLNAGALPGSRTGAIAVDGKPLNPNAMYTVAMRQSLAQGANGYFLVWPAGTATRALGQTMGAALQAYVEAHDTLSPAGQRIIL